MGWEGPIDAGAGPSDSGKARVWAPPGSAAEVAPVHEPAPVAAPDAAPRGPIVPMPRAPMTVADIIDGSFLLLKARPRTVLLVAAAFSVPFQVLAAWLQRDLLPAMGEGTSDPSTMFVSDGSESSIPFAQLFLILLIGTLPLPFVGAVLARLAAGWYAGRDLTTAEAMREGLLPRKWLWLLLAWVPVHLAEGVAMIALVVPALFVMVFFQCVAPVIALEDVGPGMAVTRSARLVTRRYGWALLVGVLSIVLGYALEQALGFLPSLLIPLAPSSIQWILLAVVDSVVAIFVIPVVTSISLLLYFDLRIRTEGLDLELRAAEVFEPTAAGG